MPPKKNLPSKLEGTEQEKVPTFSGAPGEDLDLWLAFVQTHAVIRKLANDERSGLMMERLRGRAQAWIAAKFFPLQEDKLPTPKEIEDTLRKVFGPLPNVDRLSDRVQEPGESVEEFAAEFSYLLEVHAHGLSDTEKCAKFIRALQPHLKKFVLSQGPASLDEAIELARRRQQALGETSKKTSEALLVESKEDRLTTSMDALTKTLNAVLARLTDVSTQQTHDTSAQKRTTRRSHNMRTTHGRIICYQCGKAGHIRRECPALRRNNNAIRMSGNESESEE
jgi:ribosomal protein L32